MWSKLKFGAAGVGESQRFCAWKFEGDLMCVKVIHVWD